jgi:hypothetical protein
MAENLTPQVIAFPTRGNTAVDYIDYFDEGIYGPDKAFFVNRFQTIEEIAAQIDKCLNLQNTPGSMIHVNRTCLPDKWMDPMTSKTDAWPQRAQYKIRFLLRFKFYGDYAYIDLGAKWQHGEDLTQPIIVNKEQLEVVNSCWISQDDANFILEEIKAKLQFADTTYLEVATNEIKELTQEMKAAKEAAKAAANAVYIGDEEFVLEDDGGLLTL